MARITGAGASKRLEHRSTSDGGEIISIHHRRIAQIRELVAFPKRIDLQEIAMLRGGARRRFLSAEAGGRLCPGARVRGCSGRYGGRHSEATSRAGTWGNGPRC